MGDKTMFSRQVYNLHYMSASGKLVFALLNVPAVSVLAQVAFVSSQADCPVMSFVLVEIEIKS